jgi:hypothetical protein
MDFIGWIAGHDLVGLFESFRPPNPVILQKPAWRDGFHSFLHRRQLFAGLSIVKMAFNKIDSPLMPDVDSNPSSRAKRAVACETMRS